MPFKRYRHPLKTAGVEQRNALPWVPIFFLIVFIIAVVAVLRYISIETEKNQTYLSILSSQSLLSQQIAASASQSALLDGKKAFIYLQGLRDQFENNLRQLRESDSKFATTYETNISLIENSWQVYRKKIDMILFGQRILSDTQKHAQSIRERIPLLQHQSEEIAKKLINADVSSNQIMLASQQSMLIQRIDNNLNRVMFGDKSIEAAADQFALDAKRFGRVINGMVLGDRQLQLSAIDDKSLKTLMRKVANQFRTISEEVTTILDVAPALNKLSNASFTIESQSRDLLRHNQNLQYKIETNNRSLYLWNWLGLLFGIFSLLSAIWLGFSLFTQRRAQWQHAQKEHEKQQEAIVKLLDEMSTLAEGDLTMKATVSESITGAIADSVNYAVEALRNLVVKINNTSGKLTEYANSTDSTVKELSTASQRQDEEITQATGLIVEVTESIHKVSLNASSSADVAKKSLEISRAGAQRVRNTISGMDAIRERIQSTSKRIKRLSESSQEVGNIMHVMNDIAEQTNVLALNAAIYSSSSHSGFGNNAKSGQNFSHLADEVQRLAQDAADATQKVELLVKTMLTDTKEAVASMEVTTANVVEGARNAQTAKAALNEIEDVSAQLARLIASISIAAGNQAESTNKVHLAMQNIQEITCQTTEKVDETSRFIKKLNKTTAELRESIYGFVLPNDRQRNSENMRQEN